MEENGMEGHGPRTVHEAFLALLEEAIREAGSAYKLADLVGCPHNLITRWRNRDSVPRLDTIQPVVDYLGRGFGVDPTKEQTERRAKSARDLEARADALARDNERLKTLVATLRGEISALERQLRWLHGGTAQRGRGRGPDGGRSSTGSRTEESGEEMIAQ